MRVVQFDKAAFEDYQYWIKENPKFALRIGELIKDIMRDPFQGIGKPEALKHNWKGYWSRIITDEHRPVYKVTNDAILIAACRQHY